MKYSSAVFYALVALSPAYCSSSVYVGYISELGSSGVSGKVAVFVRDGGVVGYTGAISGLEPNLNTGDCTTAANGCGVHIHSGYSCDDSTTQGGHFFESTVTTDPWGVERYTSDSSGKASFGNFLTIGTNDVLGRAFVVHNQAGARVACGTLDLLTNNNQYMTAQTAGVGGSNVQGSVEIIDDQAGTVMIAGAASGLVGGLAASDCTGNDDACGAHIHQGFGCGSEQARGNHLFNGKALIADPWTGVGYTYTSPSGEATFIYTVDTGEAWIPWLYPYRVFVIHDNAGASVSCGSIDNNPTVPPVPTPIPTPVPSPVPSVSGDPHIRTWAGTKYDFHGICDLVMLKNSVFQEGAGINIHIRTKPIQEKYSYVSSAVLQIGDDTLEVMGDQNHEKMYWINKEANADLEKGIEGNPITYRKVHSKQHEFSVEVGRNMKIVIKTWNKFVGVNILGATVETFGKSLGLLGSYGSGKFIGRDNTTILENANEFGQEWQVLPSDGMLFHNVEGPQAPERCSFPLTKTLRRRLVESNISEEEANIVCADADPADFDMCVFDVMATGDLDVAGFY